jgi:hypothetical protein
MKPTMGDRRTTEMLRGTEIWESGDGSAAPRSGSPNIAGDAPKTVEMNREDDLGFLPSKKCSISRRGCWGRTAVKLACATAVRIPATFRMFLPRCYLLRGVRSLGRKRGILRLIGGLTNLLALTTLTVLGIGPTPKWFHLRKHQW